MHIKKRRFRNKSNNTKLAALILVVLVFVCATGYAYFSQSLDLTSTAKLNTDNPFCDLTMFDGYKNFEVTYDYDYYVDNEQVTKTSPTTYAVAKNVDVDVKITIKNTGDKTVNMWRLFLKFPLGTNIVNFWNSVKVYEGEVSDGLMLIYEPPSLTFNNLMAPGEEVSFNIMYKSTTNSPDILAAGVYGWNLETESVPTAEEMAACVFDKNSSTGGSGNTGGGESGGGSEEEPEEIPNPTYAVIPSTFENSYDGWRVVGPATVNIVSTTINGTTTKVLSMSEFAAEGVKATLDLNEFKAGNYKYSAMVSRGDSGSIAVDMYYSVNGGELIPVVSGTTKPSQWETLEGTITIPENATSVDLYIVYPGTEDGDIYLANPLYMDNINLEKINDPETGGGSGDSGEGGETGGGTDEPGGDSGNTGTDQNAIIASITSDYSYDYNTLKMYTVKLTLTNNTNEDIRNWYVDIDIGEGGDPLGCWSATCSLNNNVVHITEAAWGSIVNGNSSTVIEFQFATNNYEPKLVGYGLVE